MPFVVENGNGLEDANSYASVQNFKDFASLRSGVTIPDNDSEIEKSLVAATDWIDANFAGKFVGIQAFGYQALEWPRDGLVDPQGTLRPLGYLPSQLVKATCILAVEATKGALYVNVSGASPQVIEDSIGPITTKYSPVAPSVLVSQRNFDQVTQTLSPLLKSFGLISVSR